MSSIRIGYFLFPGDINTKTGGYLYDKRIITGLQELGWSIHLISLKGDYPFPDTTDKQLAAQQLKLIPDNAVLIADGLAFSVLPREFEKHRDRLRLIALIHHPLAFETGLSKQAIKNLKALETAALTNAAHIISTSEHTADLLSEFGALQNKVSVVAPGTDRATPATPSTPETGKTPETPETPETGETPATGETGETGATPSNDAQFRLLCVAAINKRKGHAVLINALKKIEHIPWLLRCVGNYERNADTFDKLVEQTLRLGLSERISFVGELDSSALSKEYQKADLFVLASYYEGYGMVFDEAIAHTLPVIATAGGATSDTVPASASILTTPGDSHELAAALLRFLEHEPIRNTLRSGAREACKHLRSWDESAAEFSAILDHHG